MTFNLRSITRAPAWDSSTFERRVNRLFNDAFGALDFPVGNGDAATWLPAVDIFEDQNAIRLTAELPGVRPADVNITLENDVLSIHGAKQRVAEENTEQVHRYERTYGTFERSFTLPTTVDAGAIKANYEHGVLTVTLPKAEKAKPKVIEVQVSSK
jgi:HSP20 family protein